MYSPMEFNRVGRGEAYGVFETGAATVKVRYFDGGVQYVAYIITPDVENAAVLGEVSAAEVARYEGRLTQYCVVQSESDPEAWTTITPWFGRE